MDDLTELERDILAFERLTWKYAGAREAAITDRFEMTPVRYAQVKNALIDKPEAWAFDAQLVKRLRALRDARRAVRSGGRLA